MSRLCQRCGYSSNDKRDLIRHLQRKRPCEAKLSSISLQECIDSLNKCEMNDKTWECKTCGRLFNTYQSRWRHTKKCGSRLSDMQDLVAEVKQLREMIEEIGKNKQLISNTTNTINNTQNNVHIHLRDVGHENITYLTESFLTRCFVTKDILRLLENLHCDKEHPENINIRIKSQKRNQIEMRENNRWVIKDEDDALTECIQNGYRILVRHGFRHKKNIVQDELKDDEEEYHCIRDWLEQIHDNTTEQKPIKRKLLLLFLSNQTLLLGKDDE